MVAVCGLGCHECGAFFAIKERDGDVVSDRYYWSKIEKKRDVRAERALH